MKNLRIQFSFLVLLGIFTSCELGNDSAKVTLKNESSKTISSYTIESGYINMFDVATYEFTKTSEEALNTNEQVEIMIDVSENGSGDFEAIKVSVTVDGNEYSNEDSYLYYHDEGINSTIDASVKDSYDSTVYISIDTW